MLLVGGGHVKYSNPSIALSKAASKVPISYYSPQARFWGERLGILLFERLPLAPVPPVLQACPGPVLRPLAHAPLFRGVQQLGWDVFVVILFVAACAVFFHVFL